MSRAPRVLLPLAAAAGLAWVLVGRDGALRLGSLLVRPRPQRGRPPEESRLYARRRRRVEAHLTRLADGRRAILALPVDGSARAAVYRVGEARPWRDFEQQAGLVGAAWGPCRAANAGL